MVRPQKPIAPRRTKGKYFETPAQRASKYETRPSSATGMVDDDVIEIVIDLREDSAYAEEPRTEHYYERYGPTAD
jgi:hypothetical protein